MAKKRNLFSVRTKQQSLPRFGDKQRWVIIVSVGEVGTALPVTIGKKKHAVRVVKILKRLLRPHFEEQRGLQQEALNKELDKRSSDVPNQSDEGGDDGSRADTLF